MFCAGRVVGSAEKDERTGAILGINERRRKGFFTHLKGSCRKEQTCALWPERGEKLLVLAQSKAEYSDSCTAADRGGVCSETAVEQRLLSFSPHLSYVITSGEELCDSTRLASVL